MENLIKKYTDLGVNPNKLIATKAPSVACWSLSEHCLVGENGTTLDEIKYDKGQLVRIGYENNRLVSLQVRAELTQNDINEINNSDGIIITDAVYGKPHFRYGFIPNK